MLPVAAHAIDRKATGLTLPEDKPLFQKQKPLTQIGKGVATSNDEPVTLEADAIAYDQKNAVAVAHGNIVVAQGASVLRADKITYYQNQDLVVAEGNVSVLQPTGDVFFADKTELHSAMEQGVIHAFQARMSDNSVFAAHEARKISASTTELKRAVYTPCHVCEDIAPFWQVKSGRININEEQEKITYRNARMEFFGVPFFYTPYLSQPTPDAAASSGFLIPEYASSSNLGRTVKLPYYWRIDEDKAATLTPWYMSEEDWLLQGNYHQLTDKGNYELQFSATDPQKRDGQGNKTDGNEFRGHLYAKGEEPLNDFARVGFDINRTSDDTYLRRYGFGSQRVLFSRVYGEAAQQRNFALVQGLGIQGLRSTDDTDTTPFILPTLEGYYETEPTESGVRFHTYANAQSLTRTIGADQKRLSMTAGASLPHVTDNGQVLTGTVNLRQDLYNVDNVPVTGQPDFDGSIARTIPQAALEWKFPLIKPMGRDAMTVEPIVIAVAQPNGGNPIQLDNEDNTLIELSDTNLFSLDRMPGLDTVDSGSRIAYGFRTQYLLAGGESIDGMFGQNYSLSDDTPFPNSTRPGQNASDLIGRIGLYAAPVELTYRFALDNESLVANRNEVTLGFTKPWLTLYTSYRSLDNNRYLVNREEGTLYASTPLTDEWSIFGSGRRDLSADQMIATSAGLIYQNECFSLMLQGLRNFTRDRDVEPDTQFTLRIGFKNLGEFGD